MYRLLLVFFVSIFFLSAHAAELNCTPMKLKIHDKNIILPSSDTKDTAQIYFIKNISPQSVWLDHPVQHRGASAGWASFLRSDNWSALSVNRQNFEISCSTIQPGKVTYLSCSEIISICMPEVISNSAHTGTYWLAEDKSPEELLKALKKRGVEIKT